MGKKNRSLVLATSCMSVILEENFVLFFKYEVTKGKKAMKQQKEKKQAAPRTVCIHGRLQR
jgi:hypothetical protein